jgi:hypothetical protein
MNTKGNAMTWRQGFCFIFWILVLVIPVPASSGSKSDLPNLSTIASDSNQRFQLWLLRQQALEQGSAKKDAFDSEVKNSLDDPQLVLHKGTGDDWQPFLNSHKLEIGSPKSKWPVWQAAIIWSWGDMGRMEPEVQREVVALEKKTGKLLYEACIWPGGLVGSRAGRACIMQYFACDAARNKFDPLAFELTAATQKHNPDAINALNHAGVFNVAEFIRNNRGCR